jgi:hypothetical protein
MRTGRARPANATEMSRGAGRSTVPFWSRFDVDFFFLGQPLTENVSAAGAALAAGAQS